ncbi:MAG: hypothetical protein KIT87_28810, partial [Anaerolineae bacterium]|nr:hypothetical protein [Anaerolineae bacterium]
MAEVTPADARAYAPVAGERRATTRLNELASGTWRFLTRDRFALAGILIYVFFIIVAVLAPVIAPFNPQAILADAQGNWLANQPPSADFWLGTTNVGRDIFSQLVYGTRAALTVGFTAAFFVALIGTIVGLVAGY